jgi:hypothetical protein
MYIFATFHCLAVEAIWTDNPHAASREVFIHCKQLCIEIRMVVDMALTVPVTDNLSSG